MNPAGIERPDNPAIKKITLVDESAAPVQLHPIATFPSVYSHYFQLHGAYGQECAAGARTLLAETTGQVQTLIRGNMEMDGNVAIWCARQSVPDLARTVFYLVGCRRGANPAGIMQPESNHQKIPWVD